MAVPQIPMSREKRDEIGRIFVGKIEQAESERSNLRQRWERYLENYEGKPGEKDFPWPGASNAFLPISATHTDAIYARLMATVHDQDPVFLVEPVAPGDEEFARESQLFSIHIERDEVDLRQHDKIAFLIALKYGTVFTYVPWENKPEKVFDFTESGEAIPQTIDRLNRPNPRPIHPKDFLMPNGENDVQASPWVLYYYWLDINALRQARRSRFFRDDLAIELMLEMGVDPKVKGLDGLRQELHAAAMEDDFDSLEARALDLVGLAQTKAEGLKMAHVWARFDVDGDGIPEDVNFHVHVKTGNVPRIAYNHYAHRERPFERFTFRERDGQAYGIGVPEMVENAQDIMNAIQRQIIDSNTVKNVNAFKAKAGEPDLEKDPTMFPGRTLFLRDPQSFEPIQLGNGAISTSTQDLVVMQQWAERRDGISDINLGQERSSRTPATTTVALLEEANKMLDLSVKESRVYLERIWRKVLQLYAQFRPMVPFTVRGDRGAIIEGAWRAMSTEDIRKRLRIRARVSTQNLNRAVQKQEALEQLGIIIDFYSKVLEMAALYQQTQDPAVRQVILLMMDALRPTVRNIMDRFDRKDADKVAPDFASLIQFASVNPVAPEGGLSAPNAGLQGPVGQAVAQVGQGGGGGPLGAPPGRPAAGLSRSPSVSPGAGQEGAA